MNLKTHFSKLDKEHLVGELCRLVKLYPQISEYYRGILPTNGDQENLEKYKAIIKKEFFPVRGHGKCRLAVAKKAVSDYTKIARDPSMAADIMVYYVEMGADFTDEYGDIYEAFYTSIENMFEDAIEFINKHQLQNMFRTRLDTVITTVQDCGYGFPDTLSSMLEELAT